MIALATALRRLICGIAAATSLAAPAGAESQPACEKSVTVEPGDTLQEIARRCGTSVSAVLAANPAISDPDLIRVGETLALPAASENAPGAGDQAKGEGYQVETGDTLYSIAEDLGTSVQAVIEANPGLDPQNIPIGRIIRPPAATPSERDAGTAASPVR